MSPPRYRIDALIARGGMAEVHRALDRSTSPPTPRALKRMLPEVAEDPSLATLFSDEARIAARLSHPNVVAVIDAGELDGRPYLALELVDGADAGTVIARGPMPAGLAAHVAGELAAGLGHAHAARDEQGQPLGIVHRDVSPSNVLLSRDGAVKIGDFGIALGRDRRERTRTGMARGKAAYMAPEQTLGGAVDARTDVFGLGCTLAALATGKSPLADPDAMAGLLAGEAVPLDPSMPAALRAIVARAIAPRPASRYPSMDAMAADCRALAEAEGADRAGLAAWLAPRLTPPAAAAVEQEASPRPARFAWIAGLGALLVASLATWWWLTPPIVPARAPLASAVVVPNEPGPTPLPPDPVPAEPTPSTTSTPVPSPRPPSTEPRPLPRVEARRADVAPETTASAARPEAPAITPTIAAEASAPAEVSARWGIVNFRLPRGARVSLDGGATPFRDVRRGHACDTTGLCHLPVGRYALEVIVEDGSRQRATLCVSEGATARASAPLPERVGCD